MHNKVPDAPGEMLSWGPWDIAEDADAIVEANLWDWAMNGDNAWVLIDKEEIGVFIWNPKLVDGRVMGTQSWTLCPIEVICFKLDAILKQIAIAVHKLAYCSTCHVSNIV